MRGGVSLLLSCWVQREVKRPHGQHTESLRKCQQQVLVIRNETLKCEVCLVVRLVV